jgi:signal transduction histidine kinase
LTITNLRSDNLTALRQLQQASVRDSFLAHISHELRTPLNSILSVLELLGKEPNLREECGELVQLARVSGVHLLSLITQLLEVADAKNKQLTLAKSEISLMAAIESMRLGMESECQSRNVRVTVRLEEAVQVLSLSTNIERFKLVLQTIATSCQEVYVISTIDRCHHSRFLDHSLADALTDALT